MRTTDLARTAAALAAAALLLSSCAPGPSLPPYRLTATVIRSVDGAFAGRVPDGWRADDAASLPPGVGARLRASSGGASIALREIVLDPASAARVRAEGTALLGRLSLAFRGDSVRPALHEEALGERKGCSYVLASAGTWTEVVVTVIDGRVYEGESSAPTAAAAADAGAALRAFLASAVISSRG